MDHLFNINDKSLLSSKSEDSSPIPDEFVPLAERMRAKNLSEFLGQKHLTGKNSIVKQFLSNNTIFSIILWGPPGTGKTTLAKIIANETDAEFYSVNAVSSSVKELRTVISEAKIHTTSGNRVILFIDEIHRFNKAQQDALLNSVEDGTITLIGATTENPSFEVNSALLSRCRVLTLEQLDKEALNSIFERAVKEDVLLSQLEIYYNDTVKDILLDTANGDARKLLNLLEIIVKISSIDENNSKNVAITKDIIKSALQSNISKYDKKGEYHYDIISAFIKSIRGSDPDAAVYYLARMIEAGEDVKFIARRLIILASEDIGNASPNGLVLANAGFEAVNKIGMPEARIILSQVTTYLASQPKSNASYTAINDALAEVKNSGDSLEVPLHLRNAPTKLMKDLSYGKGYKYSHDYDNNFTQQQFLPDLIKDKQFYKPTENGQEKTLKERLQNFWKGKKKY